MSSSSCCPPTAHPFKAESAEYKPTGKIIKIKGQDAYVTGQTSSGKAILVGYEVFGIESGRLREICDYFASAGFYVVLADYQRGKYIGKDFSQFFKWLQEDQKWTDDQVKGVADGVVDHLKENGIKSVGVVGFCWGTWFGLKFAQTYPHLCKAFGGPHPSHPMILQAFGENNVDPFKETSKIPCILLTAGDDKPEATPGNVNQTSHANSNDVFHQYPDMKHGWVSRGDLKDDKINRDFNDAINKLLAFYQKHV